MKTLKTQWSKRLLLLSGLFILAVSVRAQVDTLFRYSPDQRIFKLWQHPIWKDIWEGPHYTARDTTRLFAQLDKLQEFASEQDDERLYWYADLHKILFRHNLVDVTDQFSTVLDEAEAHMDQCPVPVVKASYWHMRGMYYFGEREFDKGFRWLLRAQHEFERIGYQHIPEINKYLTNFGSRYYAFEDYDTFLRYMELAFHYPFLTRRDEVATYNNTAMVYQRQKAYAKADALFRKVIKLARTYGDSTYVGIAASGLGHNLLVQNEPKQALPYLYPGYRLCLKEASELSAVTALYVAEALLALDSTAKAKTYIDLSARIVTRNKHWANYPLTYYQVQAQYFKKTGNYPKATLYLDSTQVLKDSLRAVFSSKVVTNSTIKLNAERYVSRLEQLEAEKANAILIRNVIIIGLVLLTMAGIYALNQNRLKRQRERQVQAEQQKRADDLLAHATVQLDQYMSHLKEKNELIEKLSAELNQATDSGHPPATVVSPAPIESMLQQVILTEADWQQFKHLFEQVYPDFFQNLQDRYTDLTPAEIRLLALSKLGIPSKDMAFMLGMAQESVRKARYRLRKKLEQLDPDTTLESLIRTL
ncbi:transcriptional regulator [Spirosoma panaciterrae]|uniref:transcriptional regulator n=1 Tax=Spirosoma panaciterrae TaxID=496058 RepID=UPI00035C5AC2|nr:tetratricopeptide repeat protein [Spirosoma panaciterrae]